MIGDHSDCHLWFAACVSETDCHHLLSVMCMSGCELAVMCCRLVAVCSDYVHAVAVCSAYVRYICAAIILFVRWSGIIQVVIFYLRHVCQRRIVAIYHLWCAYQVVNWQWCVVTVCSDYVHAIITLRYVVSEVLPGFAWKRFGVGLLVGAKGWKSIKFLRFMRTPLLISPSWHGLNFIRYNILHQWLWGHVHRNN